MSYSYLLTLVIDSPPKMESAEEDFGDEDYIKICDIDGVEMILM